MYNYNVETKTGSESVFHLVESLKSGSYQVDTGYQRDDLAWSLPHKQKFIKTLSKLPQITWVVLDVRSSNPCKFIVDGQQRLTALKEYINNEFTAPKKFEDLSVEDRESLLHLQIPVFYITEGSNQDVVNIYQALNSGAPLNSAETRKALNRDLTNFIADVYKNNDFFRNTDFNHPTKPPFIKVSKARSGWRSIIEGSLIVFRNNAIDKPFAPSSQLLQAKNIDITKEKEKKYIKDMLDSFNYLAKGINGVIKQDPTLITNVRKYGKIKGLLGKTLITHILFIHHKMTSQNGISLVGRENDFAYFFLDLQAFNNDPQIDDCLRNDTAKKMAVLHTKLYKRLKVYLSEVEAKAA